MARGASGVWLRAGSRLGLACRGTVYLLVGYLAFRLALAAHGREGEPASSAGAVQAAVDPAWGRVPLVLLVAGLAAYALTQLLEAVFRPARAAGAMGRWRQRAVSSWGFVLYSVFCLSTARLLVETPAQQTAQSEQRQDTGMTADLLRTGWGKALLLLVGILVVAGGGPPGGSAQLPGAVHRRAHVLVRSVTGEQGLEAGKVGLGEVAAEPTAVVGASSPDEQLTRPGVDIDRRFVGLIAGPGKGGVAVLDDDPKVALPLCAQPHVELGVRVGIVSSAGDEQDPAELTDRVADEIHVAEQLEAGFVVAGDVPAMQGVFVAQVGDELRDCHTPARPRDNRVRLAVEHVADQAAHPFLFSIEPAQQRRVPDRLQRSLAFFEAPRLWHRITLQVRFEMTDDLDGDASYVRGDLVCGPSVAGAHRLRRGLVNRRQKRVRLTAALDHCTSPRPVLAPAPLPTLKATCFDHDRIILATGDDGVDSCLSVQPADRPCHMRNRLRQRDGTPASTLTGIERAVSRSLSGWPSSR
jgi:uncharacterized protein DUF1206